tara:strand:- start:51 stop:1511 length:1461 start_codon:yes stop_codon:yes gene_type:complete
MFKIEKQEKKYSKFFIYFFLTLIAFFLRFYLFDDKNSWHDEWHSIYVSNPSVSSTETLLRYYGDKGDFFLPEYAPPLYYFILKFFFKIFGYIDDNGRLLSLFFGIMIVPLSMKLTNMISAKKTYVFVGLLTSFNLFLTWQSLEIRAHSIYVALSLLSIILFYKVLQNSRTINLLLYYLVSLFLLSLWPMTGTIFFGKTVYLIKEFIMNKNKNSKLFLLFVLIFISYIILNIDYLTFNISRDYHYTAISDSFFYNYHFRTFFGSKFLGGLYLILFSVIFIKSLKNLFKSNTKEDLLIYIIISTYLLTFFYSFFKASIMSPKYVMFLVPFIIVWILVKTQTWEKFYKNSLLVVTIIFFIINLNYSPIDRPPTKKVLSEIIDDSVDFIITNENHVFNNYLSTKKIITEKKIKILKINEELPKNINGFLFICLNNPLYAVGEKGLLSNNPKIEKKCLEFVPNIKMFTEDFQKDLKFQDFYIRKFNRVDKG